MNNFIRKFYEAAAGGGSGTGGAFTLADLNAGDGAPSPADLDAARQKADTTPAPIEGVNPDGTLQEGYTKDADGKVVKTAAPAPSKEGEEPGEESTEDGGIDPTEFWADVDKRHGWELKVEYPEGIDPLSPEGVYHREKAVAAKAAEDFEGYLKKADPRGYAYMLHRQAGGNDEDFFANKTFSLPEYDAFKADVDIQKAVYRESLLAKGLDTETVQMIIDKDLKDNKLFDKANNAYKDVKKTQEQQLQQIEVKRQQAEQQYQRSVSKLTADLNDTIVEGKGINLVIPDTDKQPFLDFVKGRIQIEDGKFVIVQPVSDAEFARQLESMYFLFKKGNLKDLIAREAKTQNVKRLGQTMQKARGTTAKSGEDTSRKGFLALGDL